MAVGNVIAVAHAVEEARAGACEIGGQAGIERLGQLKIGLGAAGIGRD